MLLCLQYLDEQKPFYITYAFILFPFAVLCDVLDGWVARVRKQHSILGADLDSMADLVLNFISLKAHFFHKEAQPKGKMKKEQEKQREK